MDGFAYKLDGKPVSANDIDDILHKSKDLALRKRAWEASKELGKPLRPAWRTCRSCATQSRAR